MNTQKNLQMVLTTLLLVLAILAMDWQERSAQQNMVLAEVELEEKVEAMPVSAPVYTDCCLQHALQAAEGNAAEVQHLVFSRGPLLLLPSDSTRHLADARY